MAPEQKRTAASNPTYRSIDANNAPLLGRSALPIWPPIHGAADAPASLALTAALLRGPARPRPLGAGPGAGGLLGAPRVQPPDATSADAFNPYRLRGCRGAGGAC